LLHRLPRHFEKGVFIMATITHEGSINERRTIARRNGDRHATHRSANLIDVEGMSVSWGGIWGGVLVGLGLLLLLTALGLAMGISAVDTGESDQSLGAGATIWAAISLLLSLYVGGMVSTRIGAIFDRTTGLFEGALVWVLSLLLIVYLASSGIGIVAGGAFKLVGGTTQAIGSMMAGGMPDLSQGNVDDVLQRLRDPQTASMLSAATGTPEDQVRSNLSQIATRADAARDDPAGAAASVRQGVQEMVERARADGSLEQAAERAKSIATKTAWITFAALVLSLVAAIVGSLTGRRAAAVTAGRE
jgi:hypothetical protein